MSRELEAFKRIKDITYDRTNLYGIEVFREDLDLIETALNEKINIENRLDEIFENHNIKSFTELNERLCDYNELKFDDDLKQKKLKAFEIIKEKGVNAVIIKETDNANEYNELTRHHYRMLPLNQEEFIILKKALLWKKKKK